MEEAIVVKRGGDLIDLPPGFRFHPTDEEIIVHYLKERVEKRSFSAVAIAEADLNRVEPWDLPKRAKMGEKEWYFFCQRDRKYPTGTRTNRATESGYWKATGKDKEIYQGTNCLIGMKKTLVFYKGRAPRGEKTNWVMHEYRLEGNYSYHNLPKSAKDEWVVCRVFHKNTGLKRPADELPTGINSTLEDINNSLDFSSLPPLMDLSNLSDLPETSFSGQDNDFNAMTNGASTQQLHNHLNYQPPRNNAFNNPISVPSQNPSSCFFGHVVAGAAPNPVYDGGFCYSGRSNIMRELPSRNIMSNQPSYNQLKRCKVEEFPVNPSRVSVSQETGPSAELNAISDISFALTTKQEAAVVTSSKSVEDIGEWGYISSLLD